MRTLRFYGASDDLFEIEGTKGREPDEIGCYDQPATVTVAEEETGFALCVTALYSVAKNGCWCIGITPFEEGLSLPPWPMRWSTEGYSTVLEIDVPDGAVVSSTYTEWDRD